MADIIFAADQIENRPPIFSLKRIIFSGLNWLEIAKSYDEVTAKILFIFLETEPDFLIQDLILLRLVIVSKVVKDLDVIKIKVLDGFKIFKRLDKGDGSN